MLTIFTLIAYMKPYNCKREGGKTLMWTERMTPSTHIKAVSNQWNHGHKCTLHGLTDVKYTLVEEAQT